MPDIEIPCVQCREIFIFSEKDQEIFYQRNMMPPSAAPSAVRRKPHYARTPRRVLKWFAITAASTTRCPSSQR